VYVLFFYELSGFVPVNARRYISSILRVSYEQGSLTLSFFERRASRQLFGLVSHEERVV
jgi:hypothetical protein